MTAPNLLRFFPSLSFHSRERLRICLSSRALVDIESVTNNEATPGTAEERIAKQELLDAMTIQTRMVKLMLASPAEVAGKLR